MRWDAPPARGWEPADATAEIIEGAGLKPRPKFFENLRIARQTELGERYPWRVVCAWMGNSPTVAARHYLQVAGRRFARASAPDASAQTQQKAQRWPAASARGARRGVAGE
jgi:hypothetical protein